MTNSYGLLTSKTKIRRQYARFSRIVFDTAPTGHTLRLLSLPEFLEATLGKVVRLRAKIAGAAAAVKGLFGYAEEQDEAVTKLEALKSRLAGVRELFRDATQTEFVIVTIPTVLSIAESSRLLASLRAEHVPVHRLVVNQLLRRQSATEADTPLPEARQRVEDAASRLHDASTVARAAADSAAATLSSSHAEAPSVVALQPAIDALADAGEALAVAAERLASSVAADANFLALKRRDQARALQLLDAEPAGLGALLRVDAPLFDLEIRGVPALRFFGQRVWT